MANAAGFIHESIWRDEHWRRLSRSAQALYLQLLSQKELDCAGILPLQPNKWAKGCSELTTETVLIDLEELQRERFVFFDYDSDEAFIRTYVRNSNVVKIPNMRKAARRAALLVGSGRIKQLLAVELRATEHPELVALADEINPPRNPSPNGSPKGSPNGSIGTLPEPLPEPIPEPTGVGKGMGVGVTSRSNHLGERRPECSRHQENSDDGCRACMRRRQWDELYEQSLLDDELAQRRQLRDLAESCTTCGGTNWIPDTEPAVRCDHEKAKAAQ